MAINTNLTMLRGWIEACKPLLYCSSFHLAAKLAEVTEQLCGGDAEEAKGLLRGRIEACKPLLYDCSSFNLVLAEKEKKSVSEVLAENKAKMDAASSAQESAQQPAAPFWRLLRWAPHRLPAGGLPAAGGWRAKPMRAHKHLATCNLQLLRSARACEGSGARPRQSL